MVKNFETKWGKFKRSNLTWLLPILGLSFVLLIFLALFSPSDYPRITNIKNKVTDVVKNISDPGVAEVIGANFDLDYKKIPYDVEHLDFTFSTDLDPVSITGNVFTIIPEIKGKVTLASPNVLRYELEENLEVGTDYDITISKNIMSSKKKNLKNDYNYLVRATEKAKILQITPKGDLTTLNQKVRVFFNVPMIPLTQIENKKKLPCPIQITPSVQGTCEWLTNSVVQFNPEKGFHGANIYDIKVAETEGMLYSIEESSVTVYTPKLAIRTPQYSTIEDSASRFDVYSGVKLGFNFPVTVQEIQKNITFTLSGEEQEVFVNPIGKSENNFYITLRGKDFTYDTLYKLSIAKGLMPKYGTVALDDSYTTLVKSKLFLDDIYIYRDVLSSTGVVIDTISAQQEARLATDNVYLNLNFNEEVEIHKTYFSFVSESGENIDFDLSYNKIKKDDKEEDNKKSVKMVLSSDLKNNTKYTLKVDKSINLKLTDHITREYMTAPDVAIIDFKKASYRTLCLYTNNPLNTKTVKDSISLNPDSEITYVDSYNYIPYYIEEEAKKTGLPVNDYYLSKGYCPLASKGQNLYKISAKLNPNTDYSITFTGALQDFYGNNLNEDYIQNFKTGEIKPEDKYVTTSYPTIVNVLPDTESIVVDFVSTNMDKMTLEVCQMTIDNYLSHLKNIDNWEYKSECSKFMSKELSLENLNWNLSHNKYDLEEDILGESFSENIIYIKGYKEGNENPVVKKIFLREGLVLAFEEADNKKILMATSFDGKTSIEGVDFSFYSKNYDYNTRIYTYTPIDVSPVYNSEKGAYELDYTDYVSFVIGEKDGAIAMVDTSYDALSNYDFQRMSYDTDYSKQYLYLYTDRPLYKPGDTVYFKGLLRDFGLDGYGKSSIEGGKLKVIDQNYEMVTELDITVDENSNFNGEFVIPKEVSLGRFMFEFKNGNNFVSNSAVFYIEEYEKPVFKVEANASETDLLIGDEVSIDVAGQYYFGANMVNAKGEYYVLSQDYYFDAKKYSAYQFGEGYRYMDCLYWGYCGWGDDWEEYYTEFETDENGKYTFGYDLEGKEGEKIYTFNFQLKDPNTQKSVTQSSSIVVHNTDAYVGVKVPYWTNVDKGVDTMGVVLDFDANPLNNKKVKLQLIKREWQQVKKEGVDGYYYNDYTVKETLDKEIEVVSDSKGEFTKNLMPSSSGEYEVKAIYTGANKETFVSSRIIYVDGDDYVQWYDENDDTTDLISDNPILNVGDTQEFVLKSPVADGKALILIEQDDYILDYFVHDITSFGDKISMEVKDNYYPNFYVKAFVIGQQEGNPLPIYKRALAGTQVNTEYKKLNVEIDTDKDLYLPGATVGLTVSVTDNEGNPVSGANGTIAIVDESLLALKGNPKKNPYAYFYDMKRYLGATTSTSLKRLVKVLQVKDISTGEKGGGGGGDAGSETKKRGEFKDTAYWKSNFTTDENGKFTINTEKMPDNLTTWAIEVLVNTTIDNKVGVGYDSVIVNKELMVNENLPRFMSLYDNVTLSPVVFNKTGADREFIVTLEAEGVEIKDNSKKVFIEKDSQKTVPFQIKVNNIKLEAVKIVVKAEAANGRYVDEVEKYVQIKENVTPEYVSTTGKVKDLAVEEKVDLSGMDLNRGKLTVNYSATLLVALLDGIDFLNRFPYGCSEQKTSAVMPNIFIKKLYDSVGEEFDLKTKFIKYRAGEFDGYQEKSVDDTIKEYLAGIGTYQLNDGGFDYWYDGKYRNSNLYLTSYIVSSLSEIKKLGYSIEPTMLSNANKYLEKEFYDNKRPNCKITTYDDCTYNDITRLKVINAVLDYDPNNYEAYKMWTVISPKLEDNKSIKIDKVKTIAKLLQIKTLADEIKTILQKDAIEILNTIINDELVYTPRGAYIGRTDYYTRETNTANFIEAVSLIGLEKFSDIEPILDNMLRWLMGSKTDGSYGSTQQNIAVIKAITKYLESSGELKDISLVVKLRLNEELVDQNEINGTNKLDTFSKDIEVASMNEQNSFHIEKSGVGNVYYDMNLAYYMPSRNIKALDEGIFVKRTYYDYNEYKKILVLKEQELDKYKNNEIAYSDLEYPKDVIEYIQPVDSGKVGDLLIAHNEIITSETRDKVAFEAYIPAGSELVNVNLATEDSSVRDNFGDSIFSKTEYRTDRFFGYADYLYTGYYTEDYVIRLTHAGVYNVRPTRVSEFYNPEVFGRTEGIEFVIQE